MLFHKIGSVLRPQSLRQICLVGSHLKQFSIELIYHEVLASKASAIFHCWYLGEVPCLLYRLILTVNCPLGSLTHISLSGIGLIGIVIFLIPSMDSWSNSCCRLSCFHSLVLEFINFSTTKGFGSTESSLRLGLYPSIQGTHESNQMLIDFPSPTA
jgi:hypothetical protein